VIIVKLLFFPTSIFSFIKCKKKIRVAAIKVSTQNIIINTVGSDNCHEAQRHSKQLAQGHKLVTGTRKQISCFPGSKTQMVIHFIVPETRGSHLLLLLAATPWREAQICPLPKVHSQTWNQTQR
jgi:hypothetical protein